MSIFPVETKSIDLFHLFTNSEKRYCFSWFNKEAPWPVSSVEDFFLQITKYQQPFMLINFLKVEKLSFLNIMRW